MAKYNPIVRRVKRIEPTFEQKIAAEIRDFQAKLCDWVRESGIVELEIIAFSNWWNARMCLCIHRSEIAILWDFSSGKHWNIFGGYLPGGAHTALKTVVDALQDDKDPYISVCRTCGDCICRRKKKGTMESSR